MLDTKIIEIFKDREPRKLTCVRMKNYKDIVNTVKTNRILVNKELLLKAILSKATTREIDKPKEISKEMVVEAVGLGYSTKIDNIQNHDIDIMALNKRWENITKSICFANCYLTPAYSQCFDPHYDEYDVFIIKVFEQKNWSIEKNTLIEYPLKPESYEKEEYIFNNEIKTTFKPGEIIYIPSVHVHQAETTNTTSVHLTIGVHEKRIIESLKAIAEKEMILRKSTKNIEKDIYEKIIHKIIKTGITESFKKMDSENEEKEKRNEKTQKNSLETMESVLRFKSYTPNEYKELEILKKINITIKEQKNTIKLIFCDTELKVTRKIWDQIKIIMNNKWIKLESILAGAGYLNKLLVIEKLTRKGVIVCKDKEEMLDLNVE